MSFDEDEDDLIPGRGGEEELTLPRAAINKMIKEKIPNVRYANLLNFFLNQLFNIIRSSQFWVFLLGTARVGAANGSEYHLCQPKI